MQNNFLIHFKSHHQMAQLNGMRVLTLLWITVMWVQMWYKPQARVTNRSWVTRRMQVHFITVSCAYRVS